MKARIFNVLLANPVVDPVKIKRLVNLAAFGQIIVAVDQLEYLIQISGAANDAGTTVHVVIEVDVGLHRAGVQPGEPALTLVKEACRFPGIHFSGLLGYEGFTIVELDRGVRSRNS